MKKYDVIVLGAGMAGLSTALAFGRHGKKALVLDKTEPGAASLAAAGILDPLLEMKKNSPLLPLAMKAFDFYPKFLTRLNRETGMDPGYEQTGMIVIASNEREQKSLRAKYRWHKQSGLPVEWLTGDEAKRKEPAFSKMVLGAIYYPTVGRVQPAKLTRVMRQAALKKKVRFESTAAPIKIEHEKRQFQALIVGRQKILAEHIIIATGSWAGLTQISRTTIPVIPVRGQVAVVRGMLNSRHILHSSDGFYSVPWGRNEFLLGSTVERVGYRPDVTKAGLAQIKRGVFRFAPSMQKFKQSNAWAGLRPFCRDQLPFVGRSQVRGIAFATGFFRSGILLSPYVGELLAKHVLTGETDKAMTPFLPARYGI